MLLLAKRRSALTALHRQLREGAVQKLYDVLVKGRWRDDKRSVKLPLHKYVLASGERRVAVRREGIAGAYRVPAAAQLEGLSACSKRNSRPGAPTRSACISRISAYPVAGDDKYGDFALNKALARQGLKHMFLHARKA